MAASPRWKCYRGGEYVASCVYLEDAAAIIAGGGEICDGWNHRKLVFRDGWDGIRAAESFDAVARYVLAKISPAKEAS